MSSIDVQGQGHTNVTN